MKVGKAHACLACHLALASGLHRARLAGGLFNQTTFRRLGGAGNGCAWDLGRIRPFLDASRQRFWRTGRRHRRIIKLLCRLLRRRPGSAVRRMNASMSSRTQPSRTASDTSQPFGGALPSCHSTTEYGPSERSPAGSFMTRLVHPSCETMPAISRSRAVDRPARQRPARSRFCGRQVETSRHA